MSPLPASGPTQLSLVGSLELGWGRDERNSHEAYFEDLGGEERIGYCGSWIRGQIIVRALDWGGGWDIWVF